MFKKIYNRIFQKKSKKDTPNNKGVILIITGNFNQFETWCRKNKVEGMLQQNVRNLINEVNIRGLGVENVKNIIFTGTFWENKILMSHYFRNFFREWENATEIK